MLVDVPRRQLGEERHEQNPTEPQSRRVLGALAVLAGNAAFAGPKDEVDATEDARQQSMIDQDGAALAALLADEFVYHPPNGMAWPTAHPAISF